MHVDGVARANDRSGYRETCGTDYPATVNVTGRTLTPAVLEALTYWPGLVHAEKPEPVDVMVLAPFFDGMLSELPWWDSTWRVTHVEPATPREFASDHDRQRNRFTEVSVPLTDGVTSARYARTCSPELQIVVLTRHPNRPLPATFGTKPPIVLSKPLDYARLMEVLVVESPAVRGARAASHG